MTHPHLSSLISRLEASTGADRELEWLIADYLGDIPEHRVIELGWDYCWYRHPNEYALWKPRDSENRSSELWQASKVTGSVDAAIALATRVLPGWSRITDTRRINGGVRVKLFEPNEITSADSGTVAATEPLAICIAVLKVLEWKARDDG